MLTVAATAFMLRVTRLVLDRAVTDPTIACRLVAVRVPTFDTLPVANK